MRNALLAVLREMVTSGVFVLVASFNLKPNMMNLDKYYSTY